MSAATPDWEGFGRAIMEEWQEHGDIEASEKFDLAVRYKILVPVPGGFDPEGRVVPPRRRARFAQIERTPDHGSGYADVPAVKQLRPGLRAGACSRPRSHHWSSL